MPGCPSAASEAPGWVDSFPGFGLEVFAGKKGSKAGLGQGARSLSSCPSTFPPQFSEQTPAQSSQLLAAVLKVQARAADPGLLLVINAHSLPRKGQRLIRLKGREQDSV